MKGKNLVYKIVEGFYDMGEHKAKFVKRDLNNLPKLTDYLDEADAQTINNQVENTLEIIREIYSQEKYRKDPRNVKLLKAGKLELELEEYQPELEPYQKRLLEGYNGDYSKIDIMDIGLSIRAINCLRSYDVYNLGQLIKTGEERISGLRNLGEKTKIELRHMVYNYAPGEYNKYVGEGK